MTTELGDQSDDCGDKPDYGGVVAIQPESSDADGCASVPRDAKRRICAAAMRCFALHGTQAASLRLVAATAGVSLGLVQHHFPSKAALVDAVDHELVTILREASPTQSVESDPVADIGGRITSLVATHPDAIDYLAHLLISKEPAGQTIFDALLDLGRSQWDHFRAQGQLRSDLDPTWGALNPLILVLGTLILRSHIERQLPAPLTSPAQLRAWEAALTRLVERVHLRRPSS